MASYKELEPSKDGKPRIKITVEQGYDEETGKRLRKFKTVTLNSLSERAIKKAITEFEIEVANTEGETKKENQITFEEFVSKWMDNYVKVDLSIPTRDSYNSYLRSGILNTFGKMKLSKIKTFHIVEFINLQKKEGQRGLNGKFMVLKSIFSKAMKWRFIKENPTVGIDTPKDKPRIIENTHYDEDQMKLLLQCLEDVFPRYRIQIKLAVFTGLRMSELAGICLEDIDIENNLILINKTLKYDKEQKKLVLAPTKSKRHRVINVPSVFMDDLKRYIDEQKELKDSLGDAWTPLKDDSDTPINLLFTKENGYPPFPNLISNRWNFIIQKHNLPKTTFHGLRHTYASFMINNDVNFKIIQEQLGHSSINVTINTYSHLNEKSKIKASDLFNDLI